MHRLRFSSLVACLAMGTLACSGGGSLVVDLRSDFVAYFEVRSVRLEVQASNELFSRTEMREIAPGQDLLAGIRLAELDGVGEGPALLRATLISNDGRWLMTRVVRLDVGDATAVTILATRDCRGVTCDSPGAEACLGGSCVDERCTPETPDFCPAMGECATDTDCPILAACSMPVCQHELCFYAPVTAACVAGEWCDPDYGCRPGPIPGMDASVPVRDGGADAGSIDATLADVRVFPDGCGPELCNAMDDDCDGATDEAADMPCFDFHAGARCESGACIAGACDLGYADCDGSATNGCEVSLETSPTDCGFCDRMCAAPNGVPGCAAGACTVASCDLGYGDCDGSPVTGCETMIGDSMDHCGRCGAACALEHATSACVTGSCTLMSCDVGYDDCDGASANGCEADLAFTDAHCGACGAACALPNSVSACASSACVVTGCNTGFGDCDFADGNGCEIALTTNAAHCGACGATCARPNTMARCTAGACMVIGCAAGWADCDGAAGTGCEARAPCGPRPSCAELLAANPTLPSGVYTINPGGTSYDVYCDMVTDGGGWTLVLSHSISSVRVSDGAGAYHSDLRRIAPSMPLETDAQFVWDGMRPVYAANTDIRFTCSHSSAPLTNIIDMVFYDVPWYNELTAGAEDAVCFFDGTTGAGVMAPARRDVVGDRFLSVGSPWTRGYLSAERTCANAVDFQVDFETGGGGAGSTTNWGSFNNVLYCGISVSTYHHIWVRPSTAPTM